jgi:hypothetical protein
MTTQSEANVLETLFDGDRAMGPEPGEQIQASNAELVELSLFDMGQERDLTRKEENSLQLILHEYFNPGAMKEEEVVDDFANLRAISCEIKNINAQSILLHGERIKRAQDILKKYQEGAFTAWLMQTYGNRQTPYSILQFCELHKALPSQGLRKKLENIPRKAAYALAGRSGDVQLKSRILDEYAGEGQKELIMLIQDTFPLPDGDRRQRKEANVATLDSMFRLCQTLLNRRPSLTDSHRDRIRGLVKELEQLLSEDLG